ncbi:unnamed protein product [marine sediment metagenome]|uniref:Uncharacterized protein n=1 Tax=marine sediment metagenome TaxID=412755 RepID=X1BM66_9ZZZZ
MPIEKPVQNDSSIPIENKYWFLGSAIVVGGLVIGILYFNQRGEQVSTSQKATPTPTSTPVPVPIPTPQSDVFNMA